VVAGDAVLVEDRTGLRREGLGCGRGGRLLARRRNGTGGKPAPSNGPQAQHPDHPPQKPPPHPDPPQQTIIAPRRVGRTSKFVIRTEGGSCALDPPSAGSQRTRPTYLRPTS